MLTQTYHSVADFIADIYLIVNNARTYNNPDGPGPGRFGDPIILQIADAFGEAAQRQLRELGDSVTDAESLVRGDCGGLPMAELG
jgi:hypothetical protein